jgi:hypothetical protein
MELGGIYNAAGFDLAYYENGPWGGIVLHLDALRNGSVVATDTITISDLGGRDNITLGRLDVSGAGFDTLKIYATYGGQYSAPRMIMDDLSLTPAAAPCYANCDGSTGSPALNVNDFVCFSQRFAAADPYADCNHNSALNVEDFVCFQSAFAAGCR